MSIARMSRQTTDELSIAEKRAASAEKVGLSDVSFPVYLY
jgi:hypothetical protein